MGVRLIQISGVVCLHTTNVRRPVPIWENVDGLAADVPTIRPTTRHCRQASGKGNATARAPDIRRRLHAGISRDEGRLLTSFRRVFLLENYSYSLAGEARLSDAPADVRPTVLRHYGLSAAAIATSPDSPIRLGNHGTCGYYAVPISYCGERGATRRGSSPDEGDPILRQEASSRHVPQVRPILIAATKTR